MSGLRARCAAMVWNGEQCKYKVRAWGDKTDFCALHMHADREVKRFKNPQKFAEWPWVETRFMARE